MRIVKQRVHAAEIRFENVPDDVSPEFLVKEGWASEGEGSGILVRRYSFRKGMPSEGFVRRLSTELHGGMGREVTRLKDLGLRPVLSVDYSASAISLITLGCKDLALLASEQRGVSLFCGGGKGKISATTVDLPSDFIALLATVEFELEIGF